MVDDDLVEASCDHPVSVSSVSPTLKFKIYIMLK